MKNMEKDMTLVYGDLVRGEVTQAMERLERVLPTSVVVNPPEKRN